MADIFHLQLLDRQIPSAIAIQYKSLSIILYNTNEITKTITLVFVLIREIFDQFVKTIVTLHIVPQVPTVSEVFQEVEELNAMTTNSPRILVGARICHAWMSAKKNFHPSMKAAIPFQILTKNFHPAMKAANPFQILTNYESSLIELTNHEQIS